MVPARVVERAQQGRGSEPVEYLVPKSKVIDVQEGDYVKRGDNLIGSSILDPLCGQGDRQRRSHDGCGPQYAGDGPEMALVGGHQVGDAQSGTNAF